MNFKIFISGICIEFRFFATGYLYRGFCLKSTSSRALDAGFYRNYQEVMTREREEHARRNSVFSKDDVLEFFKARSDERNE